MHLQWLYILRPVAHSHKSLAQVEAFCSAANHAECFGLSRMALSVHHK